MASISVAQMAFIYFGGDTFRATPLAFGDLIRVILISFTVVIFDFVRKVLCHRGILNKGEKKCGAINTCTREE